MAKGNIIKVFPDDNVCELVESILGNGHCSTCHFLDSKLGCITDDQTCFDHKGYIWKKIEPEEMEEEKNV